MIQCKYERKGKCLQTDRQSGEEVDWLQSLKQFFINVSYHILVASLTLMALFKTEPSELDWLHVVYDVASTYTCSQSYSDGSVVKQSHQS